MLLSGRITGPTVGLGLGLSKPDFGTKGYLGAMRTIFLDNFDSCLHCCLALLVIICCE
jgi:hypothetical protein